MLYNTNYSMLRNKIFVYLYRTLNDTTMTTKQITRKIRDWSIIRERAAEKIISLKIERENYHFMYYELISACVDKIYRTEQICFRADEKMAEYAQMLLDASESEQIFKP